MYHVNSIFGRHSLLSCSALSNLPPDLSTRELVSVLCGGPIAIVCGCAVKVLSVSVGGVLIWWLVYRRLARCCRYRGEGAQGAGRSPHPEVLLRRARLPPGAGIPGKAGRRCRAEDGKWRGRYRVAGGGDSGAERATADSAGGVTARHAGSAHCALCWQLALVCSCTERRLVPCAGGWRQTRAASAGRRGWYQHRRAPMRHSVPAA